MARKKKKKASNSPVHVRTQQEVWGELLEQFQALKDIGALYDSGKLFYGKHLATIVYTLLKDSPTSNNNPILEQLGLRANLRCLSTAKKKSEPDPRRVFDFADSALIAMSIGANVRFIPLCATSPRPPVHHKFLSFQDWWDEEILKDNAGHSLSRHLLVNRLRSKDGGAHFDPTIDDASYQVFRVEAHPSLGKTTARGARGTFAPIPDGHLASMRQIAWELEKTLEPIIAAGPPQQQPSKP